MSWTNCVLILCISLLIQCQREHPLILSLVTNGASEFWTLAWKRLTPGWNQWERGKIAPVFTQFSARLSGFLALLPGMISQQPHHQPDLTNPAHCHQARIHRTVPPTRMHTHKEHLTCRGYDTGSGFHGNISCLLCSPLVRDRVEGGGAEGHNECGGMEDRKEPQRGPLRSFMVGV